MDFGVRWSRFLPLMEFASNNSYHDSIKMMLYEVLYGQKCRLSVYWFEVSEKRLIGSELSQIALEKI